MMVGRKRRLHFCRNRANVEKLLIKSFLGNWNWTKRDYEIRRASETWPKYPHRSAGRSPSPLPPSLSDNTTHPAALLAPSVSVLCVARKSVKPVNAAVNIDFRQCFSVWIGLGTHLDSRGELQWLVVFGGPLVSVQFRSSMLAKRLFSSDLAHL